MPGDMESTEGGIEFSLTVVGATGLSPSDDNHPTGFYVVVEVDGKQGRTAELAPSPQSIIEWNACFLLRADKASRIALRLYKCWKSVLPDRLGGGKVSYMALCLYEPGKAVRPGHLREDKVSYNALRLYEPRKAVHPGHLTRGKSIWESKVTAEDLLGSAMTLPAKVPYAEGRLIVKVERTAHTESQRPIAGESLAKPRWQGGMRDLERSAVRSVHDCARTIYFDFAESHRREKLEEAIDHCRVSLRLRPAGHPKHSTSLGQLANTLYTRFNQFGATSDLDEAIELNRAALTLRPPGHPNRS
ncbi:hypothetical protein BV22DRAFT_1134756, partial [Leucogyrophana mollusca]